VSQYGPAFPVCEDSIPRILADVVFAVDDDPENAFPSRVPDMPELVKVMARDRSTPEASDMLPLFSVVGVPATVATTNH